MNTNCVSNKVRQYNRNNLKSTTAIYLPTVYHRFHHIPDEFLYWTTRSYVGNQWNCLPGQKPRKDRWSLLHGLCWHLRTTSPARWCWNCTPSGSVGPPMYWNLCIGYRLRRTKQIQISLLSSVLDIPRMLVILILYFTCHVLTQKKMNLMKHRIFEGKIYDSFLTINVRAWK